jgi:hypothetical protein
MVVSSDIFCNFGNSSPLSTKIDAKYLPEGTWEIVTVLILPFFQTYKNLNDFSF